MKKSSVYEEEAAFLPVISIFAPLALSNRYFITFKKGFQKAPLQGTRQIPDDSADTGVTFLSAAIILSVQKAHLIYCGNATLRHLTHSGPCTGN